MKKRHKRWSFSGLFSGLLLMMTAVSWGQGSLNAVTITKSTYEALPQCLKYKVVGACFWLECGLGCSINTTLKVDHYLPDLVVTTYPGYGQDPWTEVNTTIDPAAYTSGSTLFKTLNNTSISLRKGEFNTAGSHNGDVKLREVNVMGNPALATLHWGLLLRGQSSPYFPFYLTLLDAAAWRSGLLEQLFPQSWIPGQDDVGTFLTDEWGSVYPRQGFLMQPTVGKASAVYAMRAASIATTLPLGHLSVDVDAISCPEKDCTTTGEITMSNPKIQWQMLLPKAQTRCQQRIDSDSSAWAEHQPDKQAFSWIVWREYRGCLPGAGHFLFSVGG